MAPSVPPKPVEGGLVRSALISALIAVGLFFLLEGGCRTAVRVRTGTWPVTRAVAYRELVERLGTIFQAHPSLVVSGRPGSELRVLGHQVRFNALGLRGDEIAIPKPPGRYRVVCEGGSTTFDFLAPDDASTWPARLQKRLPDADVVNAGFPGWTTLESLVSLEIREIDLQPDLVIVFAGINDLQPASHVPFMPDYSLGHSDLLPRIRGVAPVPIRLASRSVFVESLLDRIRPGRKDVEGYAPAFEWKGGARQAEIPQAAVDVFERNLRSTIGVAASRGARTLLVAQTLRFRKGHEAADRDWVESWTPGLTAEGNVKGLARYNDVTRKLAAEGLAAFVDPFAGDAFTDADFADACHFSPSGSEKLAAALSTWIQAARPAGRGAASAP